MGTIASIKDFERKYREEWVLVEVLEEDEISQPVRGKLITHSKSRENLYDKLKEKKSDLYLFFAGELPKKGYAYGF